jgi:glycosyl transferase, family 25
MVINLDRCPERFTKFSTVNGFLRQVERFPAVEGRAADREKLKSDRLLDAALTCSDGALGCALSHIMIWHRVMTDGVATTVCEDDAVLNHGFEQVTERLVAHLPAGWDFILWGWNFDAMLLVDLLPGVSAAAIHCNQDSMRSRLSRFQTLDLEPRALRLASSCGTLCYSISAGGARKLYAGCTPIKPLAATNAAGIPGRRHPLRDRSRHDATLSPYQRLCGGFSPRGESKRASRIHGSTIGYLLGGEGGGGGGGGADLFPIAGFGLVPLSRGLCGGGLICFWATSYLL